MEEMCETNDDPTSRIELTLVEETTILRFVRVLNDMGVQAELLRVVVDYGRDNYEESEGKIFSVAMRDVSASASDFVGAAVSLRIVVNLARKTRIFPHDSLPSQESVQVCLNKFFDLVRSADEPIQD